MTIAHSTQRLWQTANDLRDNILALRLQAVEDRPLSRPNKLVEDIGTTTETLAGWAFELADAAASAAAAGGSYPPDLGGVRRSLDNCADDIDRISAITHDGFTAAGRSDELNALARDGSNELRAWVSAIKKSLDPFQLSIGAVHSALTATWRELVDRTAPNPGTDSAEPVRRR